MRLVWTFDRTLLKMRGAEADLFSGFQTRLRAAIAEKSTNAKAKHAPQIADEIRRDMIEPELRKIRERMRASQRVLARKSAVGLTLVGSLVTTGGIIAGASPQTSVLGGVAAAVAATQAAASKHLEEKRDVALEDLYFIWTAAGHAPGQDGA